MFSLLFSFCFCGKDLSSFSCIFSSFNIFFFVSDKKKMNVSEAFMVIPSSVLGTLEPCLWVPKDI